MGGISGQVHLFVQKNVSARPCLTIALGRMGTERERKRWALYSPRAVNYGTADTSASFRRTKRVNRSSVIIDDRNAGNGWSKQAISVLGRKNAW